MDFYFTVDRLVETTLVKDNTSRDAPEQYIMISDTQKRKQFDIYNYV
jgi:hypothetical protein